MSYVCVYEYTDIRGSLGKDVRIFSSPWLNTMHVNVNMSFDLSKWRRRQKGKKKNSCFVYENSLFGRRKWRNPRERPGQRLAANRSFSLSMTCLNFSDFYFPETHNVPEVKPLEIFTSKGNKLKLREHRSFAWRPLAHRFPGARPHHVPIESPSYCFPRKLGNFVPPKQL